MSVEVWREAAMDTYRRMVTERKLDGGWFPPPVQMKDKEWSRQLRLLWPDYQSIKIDRTREDAPNYSEMRKWCRDKQCGHWVNNGGNIWHFQKTSVAVMFKLTFGGAQ